MKRVDNELEFDKLLKPNSDFKNFDFRGPDPGILVDFRGIDLSGSDFTGAVMWDMDLSEADLRNCIFRNVDLRGCDLYDALTDGADFTGANLLGTRMPDGSVDE